MYSIMQITGIHHNDFQSLKVIRVVQMVKSLTVIQEILVRSLGWEDPLEKRMAMTPNSCLENSMNRGVCPDTVHRFTMSQIQLSK